MLKVSKSWFRIWIYGNNVVILQRNRNKATEYEFGTVFVSEINKI